MSWPLRAVTTWPGTTLAAVLALTLLAAARLVDFRTGQVRITFDPSANSLLPDHDEGRVFYDHVRQLFGSDETLLLALVDDDVFTPENLRRIQRMTKRIEAVEGVHHVVSLTNALNIRAAAGELSIEPFVDEIPDAPGEIERIRRDVAANPIYAGNLASSDGEVAALLIYLFNMPEREFLAHDIDRKIERIAQEERGDARILFTGAAHVKAEMSRTLVADLFHTLPLASLALVAVALLSFRTLVGASIPLVTVGIALLWTLALISYLTDAINVVTVVVPPLILVVGFAYAVHVVAEYYELLREGTETGPEGPVAAALRHVALPVVLTGATTAAGFVSLMTSRLGAIRQFGEFCALGVAVTLLVSLSFAPAVLQLLPTPTIRRRPSDAWFERAASTVARFTVRRRSAILVAAAAVSLVAAYGVTQIRVSTDVVRLFDPEKRVRQDFEEINRRLQGSDALFVVLETSYRDAFKEPANLRHVEALQQWLKAQPEIGGTTSLVDYLKLINRGFHDGDPAYLAIPESRRLAAQLLFFGGNDELESFVDSSYQTANIVARSNAIDSGDVTALVRRIEEHLTSLPEQLRARVTGNSVLINETSNEIVIGQAFSLAGAFVIIYGMLALLFTSFRMGFLALIPNAVPVLVYFGTLGLTGVTLNTTTGLVACLVLGIAVDDTIHFLARFNTAAKQHADEAAGVEEALRAVGRPVTYTSLALCLGFGAIATSELRNQMQFGALAAFTLAIAWLADVLFTPALAARMRIVTLWDVLALDLGEEPTQSIPLFHGLTRAQARIAALMTSIRAFPKGHWLFRTGETGDDAFVVIDGELAASVATDKGRLHLSQMQRGDVVGEVALFHGKRTADVEITRDARLLRLTNADLDRLKRRYPRVGAQLYQNLSLILAERLARSTERMR